MAEALIHPGAPTAPLVGRTILVTRSRDQASTLSLRLQALGAHVIEIPAISIEPPRSYQPLDAALRELSSYAWLIVTSANTARVLGERLQLLCLKELVQPPTVAVGPATAAALAEMGLRIDLVPYPAVAESIVAALKARVVGQRVLLVRAEMARDLIPHALEAAGASVTIVDAYRTVLAAGSASLVAELFCEHDLGADNPGMSQPSSRKLDALTFTSSSTVTNFAALLANAGVSWPAGIKVFSIGPITSGTLRELGIEPTGEATQHDIDGLVEAILRGLTKEPGTLLA